MKYLSKTSDETLGIYMQHQPESLSNENVMFSAFH